MLTLFTGTQVGDRDALIHDIAKDVARYAWPAQAHDVEHERRELAVTCVPERPAKPEPKCVGRSESFDRTMNAKPISPQPC